MPDNEILLQDGSSLSLQGGDGSLLLEGDDEAPPDGAILLQGGGGILLQGGGGYLLLESYPDDAPATIRQAVRHRLLATAKLTAIVGDRITSQAIPQLSKLPAITLAITSNSPGRNLGGADGTAVASVRLNIWSRSQDECDAAAEAVRRSWDGFVGLIGRVYVMGAYVDDAADLPEKPTTATDQWIYRTIVPMSITYRVSRPDQLEA